MTKIRVFTVLCLVGLLFVYPGSVWSEAKVPWWKKQKQSAPKADKTPWWKKPRAPKTEPKPGPQRPLVHAGNGIAIGIEYCLLDKPTVVANHARVFGEMGIPGAKHYAEAVDWNSMQKGPNKPIDFTLLDAFVREYQENGFTELTLCLKPHSNWASVDVKKIGKQAHGGTNASPKPQYMKHYEEWIEKVVERYDHDGKDDMPGLRTAVTHLEIGSEFSSYQPEPPEIYLKTLGVAYKAAHRASNNIHVSHAAFLPTPVDFSRVKSPSQYAQVFKSTVTGDRSHGIDDMRTVLDHPEVFDAINIHPLGDPYEIEGIVKWLNYEMEQRGYKKDIIISDTINTSYIGWGPATTCKGPKNPGGGIKGLGTLMPPGSEAERCRMASYYSKLVKKNKSTLDWTRGFVAADHVQRTVIAAEQGIKLINLSFTTDLPFLTSPWMKAGAGISAWGGMIKQNHQGNALEKYPNFYSIQQMGTNLNGYDSVKRIEMSNESARVYEFKRKGKRFWVAWMNPQGVYLEEDSHKQITVDLNTGSNRITIEPVITKMGQAKPEKTTQETSGGTASLVLKHTPIYVFPN